MNKKIVILSLLLSALGGLSYVNAKVWRVNNTPGITINSAVGFSSFNAAQNAANPGDTIYMEASTTSYGILFVKKKLIIIGTGYFLSENSQTQANLYSSKIDSIYFVQTPTADTSSSGSEILGIEIKGSVHVGVSGISIIRNKIGGRIEFDIPNYCQYSCSYSCAYFGAPERANWGNSNFCGFFSVSISNIIIKQNYITSNIKNNYGSSVADIIIKNNYINSIILSDKSSVVVENNVIANNISVYNSVLKNNILLLGTFAVNNNVYSYNSGVGGSAPFGTSNNNDALGAQATVFVGTIGYSTDGQWQLKTSVPGENGADRGMFGGINPYVLSGMPPVPAVYYLNTIQNSSTINATIKIKSHN